MVIEVRAYGDFDMSYTHAILESKTHTNDSLKSLMKKFSELMKFRPHKAGEFDENPELTITSSGISGISNYRDYHPDDLVVFLISEGFSVVKTSKIVLSD